MGQPWKLSLKSLLFVRRQMSHELQGLQIQTMYPDYPLSVLMYASVRGNGVWLVAKRCQLVMRSAIKAGALHDVSCPTLCRNCCCRDPSYGLEGKTRRLCFSERQASMR